MTNRISSVQILTEQTAEWTETDRRMMTRALELAAMGAGRVSPGPLVGCVVVSPGGEVVGEGFYLYEEVKHAETTALQQAGDRARGGCAYVSLEPHAHYGRTSPCTDALIAAGIKRWKTRFDGVGTCWLPRNRSSSGASASSQAALR